MNNYAIPEGTVCCKCGTEKCISEPMTNDESSGEKLWLCEKCDEAWAKLWTEEGRLKINFNGTNFDAVWDNMFFKVFLEGKPPFTKKEKVLFT